MLTIKQKIQLALGVKRIGCKWCLILWKKDVSFKSEEEFFQHLKDVHGIIRENENINNQPRSKPTWWQSIVGLYRRFRTR